MDSLRYWVTEMHVDGFRFDLASALAREFHEVDRLAAFFDLVNQDPIVSPGQADRRAVGRRRRRLPGRRVPAAVDGVERQVPRHGARLLARRAGQPRRVRVPVHRLAPTSTRSTAAGPIASINFVTAHDGFTLHDLVSYNEKHNEANGEDNRDGESHNRSWNCGVEGPTDDAEVIALRERQKRNFLATLLLVPGRADDRPRRRAGPHPAGQQQRLLPGQRAQPGSTGRTPASTTCSTEFTARLTALRADAPGLPPPAVLQRPTRSAAPSVAGHRLAAPRRRADDRRGLERRHARMTMTVFLNGHGIPERDALGERDRRRLVPAAVQRRSPSR